MSWWTYISGTIEVDVPGRTQAEVEYILRSILDHLPRVIGSEGDMDVQWIKENWNDTSKSCDEYWEHTNNLYNTFGTKVDNHSIGFLETGHRYILVVKGDLRDCEFNGTYQEFMKWLCRLSKRLWVKSVLVRIHDCCKSTTLDYHGCWPKENPFYCMYEDPSWCRGKDDFEPAWWEHLMWDSWKDTGIPLSRYVKYYRDKEADAEWEALVKERRGD